MRDISKLGQFPSIFNSIDSLFNDRFLHGFLEFEEAKYPPVNINKITKDKEEPFYRVEFAVAGFPKDSLTINVNNDIVTVSGELENKDANSDGATIVSEINQIATRKFSRGFGFTVPVEVKNASYNNGLLTFEVHCIKPPKGKTITIT